MSAGVDYRGGRDPVSGWWLALPVTILALNLYLLLSLSPWLTYVYLLEEMAAVAMVFVAVTRATRSRRGPTLLQILIWLSLFSTSGLQKMQPWALDYRVSRLGAERLLEDAVRLRAEIGSEKLTAALKPSSPKVPPSLRALNPRRIVISPEEVRLVLRSDFVLEESLVFLLVMAPAPMASPQDVLTKTENGQTFQERKLAQGIRWRRFEK